MTLPLHVPHHLSKQTFFPATSGHDASDSTSRRSTEARLHAQLGPDVGTLADKSIAEHFANAPVGNIPAGTAVSLPGMLIVAGSSGAMIECIAERHVLTGVRGTMNDCRLLFRKAYVRARCELSTVGSTADIHVAFLTWRKGAFEELQAINFQRTKESRSNGGELTTSIEYRAAPLMEVHGLVWRGGLLRIANISLGS